MSEQSTSSMPDPGPRRIHFEGRAGLRLAADTWGDASQRPVLLLHGGGQTRHAWGSTAERLGRSGWFALAMDLRGHGDSEWDAEGDYGADAFVADLRAVVEQLAAAPVLVGASLGGIASLLAEGESPRSLCSALVLVDIATRIEVDGAQRIIQFMQARPEGFHSVEEAAAAVARYLPHRRQPPDAAGLAKNLRRHRDGRLRWHWDPAFLQRGGPGDSIRDPDRLRRAARALEVPTLLVRGKLSDLLSEEGAAEFLALVPHARYADVSGAGHMVAGDRNDVFTDVVLSFLEELGERRPGTSVLQGAPSS